MSNIHAALTVEEAKSRRRVHNVFWTQTKQAIRQWLPATAVTAMLVLVSLDQTLHRMAEHGQFCQTVGDEHLVLQTSPSVGVTTYDQRTPQWIPQWVLDRHHHGHCAICSYASSFCAEDLDRKRYVTVKVAPIQDDRTVRADRPVQTLRARGPPFPS